MLELRLLGQFDVRVDNAPVTLPSRNAQSLLAFLAMTAGTAHRRERLAAQLWPDADDDNARSYLRHALWRIRKVIEVGLPDKARYLLADDLTVAFNASSAYWLDIRDLEGAASNRVTTDGLIEGLRLYQGDLLPGFGDEWAVRERERLEAVFDRQMDCLVDRLVAEQRWADVLEWAERWIALGHVPEPAFRALMIAQSERGDRARVASVYRRCREALFEELGALPSEQTRALFERLSRGERVMPLDAPTEGRPLASPEEAPPTPGNAPFLGLGYFEEKDAARFFGRERVVQRLIERARSERFLALIGASGSGKSSLVRAGLLPRLRGSGLEASAADTTQLRSPNVFFLTPTTHPLESLSNVTASPAARTELSQSLFGDPRALRRHLHALDAHHRGVLLVVDQFEELFTLCHDPFEREAFVDNLLSVANDNEGYDGVLLALRADFYIHCAPFDELRELLARHQEYLGPMDADELRRAIEGPANADGWTFEPGLVDLLLRDVGDEPGALPLLSHALLETWRRRRGRTLTLSGYAEAGGVHGAIARTAEATLLERLTAKQRVIARRVFLRLTELGEGTQDTRRRASFDELVSDASDRHVVVEVLDVLAGARLVTLADGSAEVAHEALIREWPTLRAWLDEDRAGLRLHRVLAAAALDWKRQDRDSDLLYRGARLVQAREWAESHSAELNPTEAAFLHVSTMREEEQDRDREAQQQRELESARQVALAEQRRAADQSRAAATLRRRAIALAGALLLALGTAAAAVFFAGQARQGTLLAQSNARLATARELAAAAVGALEADPERSILLARQAVLTTYQVDGSWTTEAENALHRAVLDSRARLTLNDHTGPVSGMAYSPDGTRLASAGEDGLIILRDPATGKTVWTRAGETGVSNAIAFSPDGQRLATAEGNTVQVLDAASAEQRLVLTGHTGLVTAVVFSPDGARLATAGGDGTIRLWDAISGQVQRTLYGSDVRDLGFSPDGTRLFTVEDAGTISVWSATEASEVLPMLTAHVDGEGLSAAFSPNGRRLAAVDGTDVRIWDTVTGRELQRLTASNTNLTRLAFSPDGTRIAVGGLDRQVSVWDIAASPQLLNSARTPARQAIRLAGQSAPITIVTFAPDGLQLASAAEDGTLKIWDVTAAHELLALPAPGWPGAFAAQSPPLSLDRVAFDLSGQRLAVGLQDGRTDVWDPSTGQRILALGGYGTLEAGVAVVFSPDGRTLATAGGDGVVRLWDPRSGIEQRSFAAHGGAIFGLAFSPDGTRLASAGQDGAARIWNLATPDQAPVVLAGHAGAVSRVTFASDGRRVATSSVDGTTRVWAVESASTLLTLGPDAGRPARGESAAARIGMQPLRAMAELANQRDAVWSVDFSPDGVKLVTAGRAAGGTATIWDANTGRQLLTLSGHLGTVVQAIFSRDGRFVATGSRDGTARVWDSSTGANLLTLYGEDVGVGGVAFSPDGTQLAVGADDAVRLYTLRLENLLVLASQRLTRSWTAEECTTYLHMEICPT